MAAASPIAAGRRAYVRVRVDVPTTQPDGDGTHTDLWTPSGPDWYVAWTADPVAERVAAGTVVAANVVTVTGPYRADVTPRARLVRYDDGAIVGIRSVVAPDGRRLELVLQCAADSGGA